MIRKPKHRQKTGEKQGTGLGRGGNAPPKEYQWKPGQTGNAGGRPKQVLTDEIRILLPKACPLDKKPQDWDDRKQGKWKPRTWAQVLALSIMSNTAKGIAAAIHQLYNRLEGKMPLVIQGPEGGPIPLDFDLKNLPQKDLDALEKILEKARRSDG